MCSSHTNAHAAAHLKRFVTARVGLLLPQGSGLLVDCSKLLPLEHQRLLKLLLGLCLQKLLPKGDVRKEGGERPAELHRCLGAFLLKSMWKLLHIKSVVLLYILHYMPQGLKICPYGHN